MAEELDLSKEEQRAREKKELLQRQLDDAFRLIMKSKSGRMFIWQQIADCLVFHPLYDTEASLMYMREGKRQIGLSLLEKIQRICPEKYQVMQSENATNQTEELS